MNFSLEIIRQEQAGIYRDLRLRSFRDEPFAFSESYEDEVLRSEADFALELETVGSPPESFVLGAFLEDQLVGFVKFRRDQRSKGRHKAMIHAMYVDPSHRKTGLGSKLVNECITRAKSMDGLEQIHLWVLHADASAADFYFKCGFKSQGTRVVGDLKILDRSIDAEYLVLYL